VDWNRTDKEDEPMTAIKARHLESGDTIGIISPSWGGAGFFPHRVELGVKALESLGFRVKIAPHALNHKGAVSDTAENRVEDMHAMFADSQVKAIVAAIGGDHSCHLLPLLDFDLIRQNPKIFMGFSDITVLNVALWAKTGLMTFNGPALLTDFAEYPRMFDYTVSAFQQTLCQTQPAGQIEPAQEWTDELLDWGEKRDLERPRTVQASPGWVWLKAGKAEGILLGGCLGSLDHLRGTPYWPDWEDAVFFWEFGEDKPPPERVDSVLMDYENMGIFDQIAGMIVGRPYQYSDAQKQALRTVILERTKRYNFPIISDMDFGHTSPQFILPLGCHARIDSENQLFEIIEAAVL
jgi:muramoyltetrapeptide carboxypeptidase LdcA involved in peptidoglycan recycling